MASDFQQRDNSGSLSFSLYELRNNYTYHWSTGETTASINVQPTHTTTYYVTISNGIATCYDSVTVSINGLAQNFFPQSKGR